MKIEPDDPAEVVAELLEGYASRGVFRGVSRGRQRGSKCSYKVAWHHGRVFELELDQNRRTLRFPALLTGIPPGKELYPALAAFVLDRQSPDLPEHRRIDARRALVKSYRRLGNVSLTLEVVDGDYEYSTRKLIHLVQEIFLDFLREGPGYEYLVATFDLEPDLL